MLHERDRAPPRFSSGIPQNNQNKESVAVQQMHQPLCSSSAKPTLPLTERCAICSITFPLLGSLGVCCYHALCFSLLSYVLSTVLLASYKAGLLLSNGQYGHTPGEMAGYNLKNEANAPLGVLF